MFITVSKDYIFVFQENIKMYDIHTLELIYTSEEIFGNPYQAHIYQNNFLIFSHNQKIYIFNIDSKDFNEYNIPDPTTGSYGSTIWKNYFINSERARIRLWDIEKQEITKTIKTDNSDARFCIDTMNDYTISGYHGYVEILNLNSSTFENFKCGKSGIIFNIHVYEKLNQFVVGSYNGCVEIIDFDTKNIIYSLDGLASVRTIYFYDNTICYTDFRTSFLNFYEDDNILKFPTEFALFSLNGDLVYWEENVIKIFKIPRPYKQLKKLIHIKTHDLFINFK